MPTEISNPKPPRQLRKFPAPPAPIVGPARAYHGGTEPRAKYRMPGDAKSKPYTLAEAEMVLMSRALMGCL